MTSSLRQRLEQGLAAGQDDALLRYTLGDLCLKDGDVDLAIEHLRQAVAGNAEHSPAWKRLGQALSEAGDEQAAAAAFEQGLAVARRNGDRQAEKEMTVFRRRLDKQENG